MAVNKQTATGYNKSATVNTHEPTERRTERVFILVFILLVASIVAVGAFYCQNYERQFRAGIEHQLSAIAELKVGELAQWRKERLDDANILFKNASLSALVRRFFEKPEDADAQRPIQDWLGKYPGFHDYDQVRLMDAQGVTRLLVPAGLKPASSNTVRAASKVLRSGQIALQDFYRNEQNQRDYLAVLVPILDDRDGNRPLGVLVLRIDPERRLYPFIKRWPTPSPTAETLLLRREGNEAVFLNELRFQTNTALNLRSPLDRTTMPAVQAVLGRKGIMEGIDYRGVPVVAALRTISDSPWALAARMDTAEVYAPMRERLWQMVIIIGLLLLGAGACVGLVWRQQRVRFYRERAAAAETIRESKDHLENLINHANAPIIVWNPQFRITRFNHAFESLTGRKAGDVVGGSLEILFPPAQVANSIELIKKTLAGERWETVEIAILHRDGSVRTVHWNSATIFAPDGKTPMATIAQGHDITERKRAEEELELRNEELIRFTYTVSHDLKSPVVTIRTFLGYLEQDTRNQDAARVAKDLDYIRTAADKMSRLLDELLELSRIGHKVNPSVEAPLQAIVNEALALVAGRIAQRGAQVQVTEEPMRLYGDRPRLVQVFQNLVDNAVKFMGDQPAPRVEIGVEPDGDEIVLFVRDNGLGIDPRHQPKLFGLFEKLDPATEGTGIGLALARRIVEVHGGRIWVESAGVGQGATFRFTLPKNPAGSRAIRQAGKPAATVAAGILPPALSKRTPEP